MGWLLLLAACDDVFDLASEAEAQVFPLTVPVARTREAPPPGAVPAVGCEGALAAAEPDWAALVDCADAAVAERMFAANADPSWIGRWYVAHERWDPRLVDVVVSLAERSDADLYPALHALSRQETSDTIARLTALWDERPEMHRALATALAASSDRGLADRLDRWCVGREDFRCLPDRRRGLRLAAHPVDDLTAALADYHARPEGWLEAWPAFRGAILDALERGAAAEEPDLATRAARALALADRPRAAAAAARWNTDGTTWEGWDLRTGLARYPDDASWAARVDEAGGALPAAHLVDGWVRAGKAFGTTPEGFEDLDPARIVEGIFLRVPGDDPIVRSLVAGLRDPPFETRTTVYAWWGEERWRVAESGSDAAAAVGLANALLAAMARPERAGLTGDQAWVVVGDGGALAAAGEERLVTWYDPRWQGGGAR